MPYDAESADPGTDETAEPESKRKKSSVDLQALVRSYLASGIKYRDDVLKPKRERAQDYFSGEETLHGEFKPQEDRSRFVSRDVRDTIMAVLAQLVAVFFGNDESCVEFEANSEKGQADSERATKYVNYIVRKHGGLELFLSVFLDALKLALGPVRYWWDESKTIKVVSYSGLTPAEFDAVMSPEDEAVTAELVSKTEKTVKEQVPALGQDQQPTLVEVESTLIDCEVRETSTSGRVKFSAVPPEERICDPDAASIYDGRFWFQVKQETRSELVRMGYDKDEVAELGEGDRFLTKEEADKRVNAPLVSGDSTDAGGLDPTSRKVLFVDGYVRADMDGDGIAELIRVCAGGTQVKILSDEPCEDIQVAEFQTYPTEHTATGESLSDATCDIQLSKTGLFRCMFDSLAQSIFPQRGYDKLRVDATALQSGEAGANIPCTGSPNAAVQEFTREFKGREVLAVIQAMEDAGERRTGFGRMSAGLKPDALQSTDKEAAHAAVVASQRQSELIARVFATFGFKPLFKGILKLIVRHQNKAVQVKLGGDWVSFDPRQWDSDMNVVVRTGLGGGTMAEKLKGLAIILEKQEKIAASGAPLTNWNHIYNTLAALCNLIGYKDAAQFFIRPPEGTPMPPPPSPPADSSELLAKAQAMQAETERNSAREKNTNERIELFLSDDRERDKQEAEMLIKIAELQGKYPGASFEALRQQVSTIVQRERNYGELGARVLALQAPIQPAPQQGPPQQGPPSPNA